MQQIGDELGVSRQRVHQIAKRLRLKWQPYRSTDRLRYWLSKGLSNKEIALMINRSPGFVAKVILAMPDREAMLERRRKVRSKPGVHWRKLAAVKKVRGLL